MRINIRAKEIELTPAIKAYVEKKLESLENVSDKIVLLDVEVSKITKHHKKGDLYATHVTMSLPGKVFRVEKTEKILYKSIDKVKDDLKRILKRFKGKYQEKHKVNKENIRTSLAMELDEIA